MDALLILHMQDEIGLVKNGGGAVSFFRPLGPEAQAGLRSGIIKDSILYAVGAYSGMLYIFSLPQLSLHAIYFHNTTTFSGKYTFLRTHFSKTSYKFFSKEP